MTRPALHTAAAILWALTAAASAAPYEQTIAFREPLGQTWTDELVHYELKVPQPRIAGGTFALADAEGKPVSLQVETLEGKPDAILRARLWWKMTLPAGREVSYRLTYNDEGKRAVQPGPRVVVRRGNGRLIVLAGRFEVMIPAPDKPFEKPLPLKKAPPPLLGLRPAGEQAWYGAWSLDGPSYVRELKTTVERAGPVWAQVRLRYVFDDRGQSYDVVLRIIRDEPWLEVSERYRTAPGCRMTASLRGRRPAEVFWMPWFVGSGDRTEPAYDLRRLVLDERVRAEAPLAALRPRYTHVRDASQVLLVPGPGDVRATFGLVMTRPGDWARPYENFPTARPLVAASAGDAERKADYDGVAVDFPLVDGRRRWLLVAAARDQLDSKDEVQRLIRRAADLPLDRILGDWVLTWPRGKAGPGPHILVTWDRLRQLREDLAAGRETAATKLLSRILAGEASPDRQLAEILAGRREAAAAVDAGPILAACYQDPELARAAWQRLPQALVEADLAAAGRAPAAGEPSTPLDAAVALLAYVFTDANYQPAAAAGWEPAGGSAAALRYRVPLYAAAMMPDHPHAARWAAAALAAIREDFRRAAGAAADGKAQEPPVAVMPEPAQQAAALAPLLAAMRVASGARLEDPFRWPEVRPVVEWLLALHTPPDPRLGRRDLAPFGGAWGTAGRRVAVEGGVPPADPWHDGVGAIFGLAAAGFKASDAALASQCMALYGDYCGAGAGGDLAAGLAAAEGGAAAGGLDAALAGRAWPGFGAVLRSRTGSDRETFVAFKCGPARTAPGPDEMAFHFFGAGVPLALAWHAGPSFHVEQEHMYNRISLGEGENMDAAGEILALGSAKAADVAVGQVRTAVLRKLPRYPHEIGPATAFARRTLAAESRWRRYLALVRHEGGPLEDYLVIRDELTSTEPSAFNLWALARSVRQEGRLFVLDGQLAADLVVFVAVPGVDRIRLDRWAWPRQDESSMIPQDFRTGQDPWRTGELQQYLSVGAGPGEDFLVVVYPLRKGAPVPRFQTLAEGRGVRVTLSGAAEDVYLSTDSPAQAGGQAVVRRGGQTTVILKPGALPPFVKAPAE